MAQAFVLAVIFLVAGFDVIVGVRLLCSPAPFLVNGANGTLWSERAPALWQGVEHDLLASLYRRLGAFSLHTGVVTALFAFLVRDTPWMLGALLGTYSLTGLAFLANDRGYFRGTRYFMIKQALGVLWSAALIVSVVDASR